MKSDYTTWLPKQKFEPWTLLFESIICKIESNVFAFVQAGTPHQDVRVI